MSTDRHLKAQDVFNQTKWVFGTTTDFGAVFPEIRDVSVRVVEYGDDLHHGRSERTYTRRDIGEYINCHNPRCYNGGFRVGEMLRQMVAARQADSEHLRYCQGYEGSPKGRKNYGPCDNRFEIAIHIDFEPQSSDV